VRSSVWPSTAAAVYVPGVLKSFVYLLAAAGRHHEKDELEFTAGLFA
jgi:hypothetical protein